ncbi:MAG: hypothetical protein MUQ10_10575, partial [Anaerolineae bacterium]|nr:hypothetical protein [Anaerolineae bacterium]
MTNEETHEESGRASFARHLRRALFSLYDPAVLRGSPLVELFGRDGARNPASALRDALTRAIESHQASEGTPADSKAWRVYQILRRRYVQQNTQREVALGLGLSIRQLRREEKLARDVLVDFLWSTYGLESRIPMLASQLQPDDPDASESSEPISRVRELAWLKESVPAQMVDAGRVLADALDTLAPVLQSSGTSVVCRVGDNLPRVLIPPPALRQALLGAIGAVARYAPTADLRIAVGAASEQVFI